MKKEKQEGNMWERPGRWRRNEIRPFLNTSKLENI